MTKYISVRKVVDCCSESNLSQIVCSKDGSFFGIACGEAFYGASEIKDFVRAYIVARGMFITDNLTEAYDPEGRFIGFVFDTKDQQ